MARIIDFEAATDAGAQRVAAAVAAAFEALESASPTDVSLTYWRVRDSRRFVAILELADESTNPLLELSGVQELPQVIATERCGEYPAPVALELLGEYGEGTLR